MTKDDLIAFVQRLRPSGEDFLKISTMRVNDAFKSEGKINMPAGKVDIQQEQQKAAAVRKRVNSERDDEHEEWRTITCPLRTAQSKFMDANIALWAAKELEEEDLWFDACFAYEESSSTPESEFSGPNIAEWIADSSREQDEWSSACSGHRIEEI